MSAWIAFWKKEWMELVRSGKFFILMLVSALFGIMNPAIAKLTPWLMEAMSESFQESGIQVGEVTVDALTSWAQFYKNMPMALIVAVLIFCGIFTQEYQKGTLILVLTKGMSRRKVYGVKALTCLLWWSLYFWMSYGITWLYSGYYWDNGTVSNILTTAALFWVFGVWVFCLIVFFSTLCFETSGVLAGTGMLLLVSYIAGIFPKVQDYLPTKLLECQALLTESAASADFLPALLVTVAMTTAAGVTGMFAFDKKKF